MSILPARQGEGGVTLIELLIVLAVIAALGAAMYVRFGVAKTTASDNSMQATARSIAAAISSYYLVNGCYPPGAATDVMPPGMTPYVNHWPVGIQWAWDDSAGTGTLRWLGSAGWISETVFAGSRC